MRHFITAIVIFLIALLLRLSYINVHSFWVDEAFTVNWCSESLPYMLLRIAREDRHPPLYCMLSYPLLHFAQSEITARFVSAIAGASLVTLIFAIGTELAGIWCGVLSATFVLFHPGAIRFSQEARPYMLYACLATGACLLWMRAYRTPKWHTLWAMGIISSLSLYACYMAFIPWLARIIAASLLLRLQSNRRIAVLLIYADSFALASLMPYIAFVLMSPHPGASFGLSSLGTWLGISAAFLFNDLSGYEYGLRYSCIGVLVMVLMATAFGILLLIASAWKMRKQGAVSLVIRCWFILHFSLLLFAPLLSTEFNRWQRIIDGLVPVALMLGWIALHPRCKVRRHERILRSDAVASSMSKSVGSNITGTWSVIAQVTLMLLIMLHLLGTYNLLYNPQYSRDDWRGATQWVMQRLQEGDIIILNAPVGSFVFRLYYRGIAPYVETTDLRNPARWNYAAKWLANLLAKHPRVFVITNRVWQTDPHGWLKQQLSSSARLLERWRGSGIMVELYAGKSR